MQKRDKPKSSKRRKTWRVVLWGPTGIPSVIVRVTATRLHVVNRDLVFSDGDGSVTRCFARNTWVNAEVIR